MTVCLHPTAHSCIKLQHHSLWNMINDDFIFPQMGIEKKPEPLCLENKFDNTNIVA